MGNLMVKLILIGACIGLGLGLIGNFAGKNTLDYKAQYNFPGADDNRINKNLDDNPNIPEYPRTNTVLGGAISGLIAGALIGLCVFYFKSETFYILALLIGFFAAPFVVSPYPFYPGGTVPPVDFAYRIHIFVPGMLFGVLAAIFLEKKFKPAEAEAPEAAEVAAPKADEKPKGNQWHHQKKKNR
ncbi:MAG: hypothetical protein WCI43_00625 [Candidatus Firestonebacteria bacterium]